MARWVFLADPRSYGWDDLVEEGRAVWDGIKNRTAQIRLGQAAPDDEVLIYHTAPDRALVGTARVVAGPYPDPAYDDRVVVDLEPVAALASPLPMASIREDDVLGDASFVRMPRVAIHALSDEEWDRIMELSGTDPGGAEGLDSRGAGGP